MSMNKRLEYWLDDIVVSGGELHDSTDVAIAVVTAILEYIRWEEKVIPLVTVCRMATEWVRSHTRVKEDWDYYFACVHSDSEDRIEKLLKQLNTCLSAKEGE